MKVCQKPQKWFGPIMQVGDHASESRREAWNLVSDISDRTNAHACLIESTTLWPWGAAHVPLAAEPGKATGDARGMENAVERRSHCDATKCQDR